MNEALAAQILAVVQEIPEGQVVTYGQIARLAGYSRSARYVGQVLARADLFGDYPCHRVVDRNGRTAPGWPEQAALLEAEGIPVQDGRVDLEEHQWNL